MPALAAPHFKNCSTKLVSRILANASILELKKNETLFQLGLCQSSFGLILDGFLEVTAFTESGHQITHGVFGPGDTLGLFEAVNKASHTASTHAIQNRTMVLIISFNELDRVHEPPFQTEFLKWIQSLLSKNISRLVEKIEVQGAGRAEDRIQDFFKHLIKRFGTVRSPEIHEITAPLTRAHIARFIDVRVETVMRIINQWQKQKRISWIANTITLKKLSRRP